LGASVSVEQGYVGTDDGQSSYSLVGCSCYSDGRSNEYKGVRAVATVRIRKHLVMHTPLPTQGLHAPLLTSGSRNVPQCPTKHYQLHTSPRPCISTAPPICPSYPRRPPPRLNLTLTYNTISAIPNAPFPHLPGQPKPQPEDFTLPISHARWTPARETHTAQKCDTKPHLATPHHTLPHHVCAAPAS
jgi:hypothetical protein